MNKLGITMPLISENFVLSQLIPILSAKAQGRQKNCQEFLFQSSMLSLWNFILQGLLYEGRGLQTEALKSFENALDVESNHVPSLISTAIILRKLSAQSLPVVKSFLTDALRLDRTNPSAWYNLGLLYKAEIGGSALEAAECFEAAAVLQESAPVEPFRWYATPALLAYITLFGMAYLSSVFKHFRISCKLTIYYVCWNNGNTYSQVFLCSFVRIYVYVKYLNFKSKSPSKAWTNRKWKTINLRMV